MIKKIRQFFCLHEFLNVDLIVSIEKSKRRATFSCHKCSKIYKVEPNLGLRKYSKYIGQFGVLDG